MKYRREIDGLRAVAVLPVILFHGGSDIFSGGYIGVDVFFVISGYLITTIIATEIESGTFRLSNFYERRARRILPALFLVLAATLPFAWLWMYPTDFGQFSLDNDQCYSVVDHGGRLEPLVWDNSHLTRTGAVFTAKKIRPKILDMSFNQQKVDDEQQLH